MSKAVHDSCPAAVHYEQGAIPCVCEALHRAHAEGLREAATTILDWTHPWVSTTSPWATALKSLLEKLGAGERSAAAQAAYAAGRVQGYQRGKHVMAMMVRHHVSAEGEQYVSDVIGDYGGARWPPEARGSNR